MSITYMSLHDCDKIESSSVRSTCNKMEAEMETEMGAEMFEMKFLKNPIKNI